jgi:hypothetical protein
MIVLAYLGSEFTKFHTARWTCWFFTSFYLGSCIWPDAISRWIRQRVCIRCANLGKREAETLAMIRQAFGEESMSRTWVFEWRSRSRAGRKGETGEKQSQEHAHHFFTWRGLLTKSSSWHAKKSIPHTTVTFYGDCVKICEYFVPNLGDKIADCCIMTTHCLSLPFSQVNIDQKQHGCPPPNTTLFSLSTDWK